MFTSSSDLSGAPGLVVINPRDPGHIGALVVDNTQVPEGEHTGVPSDGSAGGLGQVLNWAGGGLGVGAVAPVVDNHRAIGIQLGGAPGGGGVLVGALVILHTIIGEGEHTCGAIQGAAGVRDPLGELEASFAWELEGVG